MPNYNSTLQSNNTDLQAILNTINELPEAGGSDPVLQDKTVTPTTSSQTITADSGYDGLDTVTVNAIQTETKTVTPSTSQQNVTPTSGKYLSKVTVNAVPTATQATPSITINASGLITATATQTAGYVTAGTKSATKQLAFQAAKTITPSTANQIAVSSGYYTGGSVTVKGDSNLVAENIKSGVSIFGINGTYKGSSGSSGGNTGIEDNIITRTISGAYTNDRVTFIGDHAFPTCYNLTSVSFPAATSIGSSAFAYCYHLTSVSFPKVTDIGNNAFGDCSSLISVNFPKAIIIGGSAFYRCSNLTSVSFPAATDISNYAFGYCSNLTFVNFPKVTYIGNYAFSSCSHLTSVSFPKVTNIGGSAFCRCSNLTSVSFPVAVVIGSSAFAYCYNLKSLYLTGSIVCRLSNSNAFSSTPIGGYSILAGTYGSIYVPTSLLTSYKTATNWTYFSSRFVGI